MLQSGRVGCQPLQKVLGATVVIARTAWLDQALQTISAILRYATHAKAQSLSHFSATMTAQNYVQLTWVSQTETNLMGYNVYRSDSDDLSSAAKISDLIGATNT